MNNLMLEDFIAVDFRDCFGIIYDVLAIWIYEHETFNNKSHVVLEGGKNERVIWRASTILPLYNMIHYSKTVYYMLQTGFLKHPRCMDYIPDVSIATHAKQNGGDVSRYIDPDI